MKNKILESHIFTSTESVRVEKFAREKIQILPSNKSIKKAILKGHIRVNSNTIETSYWMKKGDRLELYELTKSAKVYEFPIDVAFEDDHLAIVTKPSGLSVHNNQFRNLINCLDFNLRRSSQLDSLSKMHPIHRLDQQTTGLIIIAKSMTAQMKINEQLSQGKIKKFYSAIVHGSFHAPKIIDQNIDDKNAKTEIISSQIFGSDSQIYSLLKIRLWTGRTHQIRIHCSAMDYPIVGDRLYSNPDRLIKGRGLMLTANHLEFEHPISHEKIEVQIPVPKKFLKFIRIKSSE